MFGCTTSTHPMPFHTISITIVLIVLRRFILYTLPIFLFCLNITPLLVVQWGFLFMRIWGITTMRTVILGIPSTTTTMSMSWFSSKSMSLGRYYIHFREWFKSRRKRLMISHQKAHYFVQQQRHMILIQSIL